MESSGLSTTVFHTMDTSGTMEHCHRSELVSRQFISQELWNILSRSGFVLGRLNYFMRGPQYIAYLSRFWHVFNFSYLLHQFLCCHLYFFCDHAVAVFFFFLTSTNMALLSAALHSNAADYVLRRFILFYFFYSPFVLRNYSTDSHKIFRNCVF